MSHICLFCLLHFIIFSCKLQLQFSILPTKTKYFFPFWGMKIRTKGWQHCLFSTVHKFHVLLVSSKTMMWCRRRIRRIRSSRSRRRRRILVSFRICVKPSILTMRGEKWRITMKLDCRWTVWQYHWVSVCRFDICFEFFLCNWCIYLVRKTGNRGGEKNKHEEEMRRKAEDRKQRKWWQVFWWNHWGFGNGFKISSNVVWRITFLLLLNMYFTL